MTARPDASIPDFTKVWPPSKRSDPAATTADLLAAPSGSRNNTNDLSNMTTRNIVSASDLPSNAKEHVIVIAEQNEQPDSREERATALVRTDSRASALSAEN